MYGWIYGSMNMCVYVLLWRQGEERSECVRTYTCTCTYVLCMCNSDGTEQSGLGETRGLQIRDQGQELEFTIRAIESDMYIGKRVWGVGVQHSRCALYVLYCT